MIIIGLSILKNKLILFFRLPEQQEQQLLVPQLEASGEPLLALLCPADNKYNLTTKNKRKINKCYFIEFHNEEVEKDVMELQKFAWVFL